MGILMDGKIWISKDIQDGYFNLYTSDALIGLQAIVYSYLKAKFDKYGVIDTLHNKMAQELGLSQKSFSSVVNNLQKCDYIRFEHTGRRVNIIVNPLPIRSEAEPRPAIIPASPDIRPEPVMMFPRYISPIEELQMRAARGQDVHI